MGEQHHYPAALIGNFSSETSGPRRDRKVFCARRGVWRPLPQTARQCGVTPRQPRLYDGPPGVPPVPMNLDELWQMAEGRFENVVTGLSDVEDVGSGDSSWAVMEMAPFLASLLARHPKLAESGMADLTKDPTVQARGARWAYFGILVDVVLFRTKWTLAIAPANTPWTTNDIGAVWLPGRGAGSVLIPLGPRHAIMLTAGAPTYGFKAARVGIGKYVWDSRDVAVVNELIARSAPREVYALEAEQIETAMSLWSESTPSVISAKGAPADCLASIDATTVPRMLLQGGSFDYEHCWARFIAATHLYACNCNQLLELEDPELAGRLQVELHGRLNVAERSLRGSQTMHAGSELGSAIVINDKGDVVEANRAGFIVRRSPANVHGYIDSQGV